MTPEQLAALRAVHQGGLFALAPRTTVGDIVDHIDAQDHHLQLCEEELRGTRGLLQLRELEHKRLRDLVEHLQEGQDCQDASIDALKADLRHARLWANWRDGADTTFTSHPTQGVRQAAPFCWDSEKRETHNVTASDGWRVGDLVT